MRHIGLSLRSFRRAPGFVAIATLSLGVALGLSTSVFALMDAMTHPVSPYRDVDQLFEVLIVQGGRRTTSQAGPSRRELEASISGLPSVQQLTTARWFYNTDVEAGGSTGETGVAFTRPGFFELLGVQPGLGKFAAPGERGVAVVSDALWRDRFGLRSGIAGATVTVAGQTYPVVGVLPARAATPYGTDVWIRDPAPDSGGFGRVWVRLRQGATERTADAELKVVAARLTQLYTRPSEKPYAAWLNRMAPDPLALSDYHRAMIGAAICVLLIACANVSALMLARGMVRRRDYALRLALGARRWDIAREVIVEMAALAVFGCVAGAIVATWAVGLMTRATPEEMQWLGFVPPHWSVRVLALSALAVIASIAVAGGVPAWHASRTDPATPLKENTGGSAGRAGTRFRWLVMAELALSMTLLVSSSLMLKSVTKMARYDFGYDARGLVSVDVGFGWRDGLSLEERERVLAESLDRIRATPGVQSAAALSKGGCSSVLTTDRSIEGGAAGFLPQGCINVSPDFFRTLGIQLVDGRDFGEGDASLHGAVILDQRTAKRLFPHERAVGRMVKLGTLASTRAWIPVVGVVRDQPLDFNPFPELGADTSAVVYASIAGEGRPRDQFVVRPTNGVVNVPVSVARTLKAALKTRSHISAHSWVWAFDAQLHQEQYLTLVFALLGAASLALGAAGLFSVISYVTGQRMREFAVRIALGATGENVLRLVMREGLVMALGGTAIGAGLGMWAGFLLWDKMWGVYPVDVGALIAAEATLLLVTMLACLVPARRATRSNPVDVLRAI
jgi:putative ABC transport system permease protein